MRRFRYTLNRLEDLESEGITLGFLCHGQSITVRKLKDLLIAVCDHADIQRLQFNFGSSIQESQCFFIL